MPAMRYPIRWLRRVVAYALILVAGTTASSVVLAAQVSISPLSLSLGPDKRATTLSLHNEATTPVSIQVRVFAWRQDLSAGMLLDPTGDIAFGPVLVTLNPGVTQLVRFQMPNQDVLNERYYRVLVDELPDPERASRNSVQVLTRYSVPLFVEPRIEGTPHLQLARGRCSDNREYLIIRNDGKRRARLANWKILAGGETLSEQAGLAGYALPGSALGLPLPEGAVRPRVAAQLMMDTDVGTWQVDIPKTSETGACENSSSPR